METSRCYAIERGGPERLELRWHGSFQEVRVVFDGALVGQIDRNAAAKRGTTLALPDGSTLTLRLRGMLGIEVLRDGAPLPGSDLDPRRVLRNAAILLFVLGVLDGAADLYRASHGMPEKIPLALDGVLLAFAAATFGGVRVALALGIAAFALRFGLAPERSTWTLIFGAVATWLLTTHYFAAGKRRR